ncbi:hypothetical protein HOF92_16740 [bacterium]|nr:hypothetical protein [bacterium]
MTFTSPGPPSCLGNHIAIPDGPSVRVFEVSGTLPPTIREVQRIDSVDSTSGETLSASLDVLLADSYLYILEKDRDRVLKYTVK